MGDSTLAIGPPGCRSCCPLHALHALRAPHALGIFPVAPHIHKPCVLRASGGGHAMCHFTSTGTIATHLLPPLPSLSANLAAGLYIAQPYLATSCGGGEPRSTHTNTLSLIARCLLPASGRYLALRRRMCLPPLPLILPQTAGPRPTAQRT